MFNLLFALLLALGILWIAKKFYFPSETLPIPEKHPIHPDAKISKKDLTIVLSNLQRWKKEGKITRVEYDHLTDICLSEIQQISHSDITDTQ